MAIRLLIFLQVSSSGRYIVSTGRLARELVFRLQTGMSLARGLSFQPSTTSKLFSNDSFIVFSSRARPFARRPALSRFGAARGTPMKLEPTRSLALNQRRIEGEKTERPTRVTNIGLSRLGGSIQPPIAHCPRQAIPDWVHFTKP